MQSLLPWVFALDHINYARWLSMHLMDMLPLRQRNENIARCFENGLFLIRKTKSPIMNRTTSVLKEMEVCFLYDIFLTSSRILQNKVLVILK